MFKESEFTEVFEVYKKESLVDSLLDVPDLFFKEICKDLDFDDSYLSSEYKFKFIGNILEYKRILREAFRRLYWHCANDAILL